MLISQAEVKHQTSYVPTLIPTWVNPNLFIYLLIYFITSTIWCGTHNRAGVPFKRVHTDNPPSPGKVDYTTGVYVLYSF